VNTHCLILGCLCESCSLIAPLEDFIIDAIGYVISRAIAGRVHIGLRCPRCQSDLISEGEIEGSSMNPTPQQNTLTRLRHAIDGLDVRDDFKRRALDALDRPGDEWRRELLELARKAA
jgi:hypothetical protein